MATWRLPPQDNGLKCVIGVSLKSTLLESDHVRRRETLRAATRASASCHVTSRRTQVLSSGASANCLLPLCTNSLFRKWEEEEITDQRRTNSLTSSSCLSTFRTSCVFSSEREKERRGGEKNKQGTYWSADRRTALHDNSPTPPQRGKRGGRGGEKRGWEKTTHEDTFEDIFTHSLYTRSQHLMSRSYWRLRGLCWVFVIFFFFPPCWGAVRHLVPTQREGRCQLCSLARSLKSHSEWLTRCSAPHPQWLLLHIYPLKLITTCESFQRCATMRGASPALFQATPNHLLVGSARNWLCCGIELFEPQLGSTCSDNLE